MLYKVGSFTETCVSLVASHVNVYRQTSPAEVKPVQVSRQIMIV